MLRLRFYSCCKCIISYISHPHKVNYFVQSADLPKPRTVLMDLPKLITSKMLAALNVPDVTFVENMHRDINTATLKIFTDQETAFLDELEKNRKAVIAKINAATATPVEKRLEIDSISMPVSRVKKEISTIYEVMMNDIWKLNESIMLPYARGIIGADEEIMKGLANFEQDTTKVVREILNQYDLIDQEFTKQIDEVLAKYH